MSDRAIKVDHVSKSFKLPHEKNTSIKSAVLNFYKRNKSYDKQQVLENVSFEVKKGEFFGIVGRNGSGKSTMLKLLAQIHSPDIGHIQIDGKLTPFIELGVGFNPELTGRENVYLNGALLGFNRTEMNSMYKGIVEFSELEKFMDQKLKNYSSGMQVRLAFSIAVRANSDILLLDEVLAVGDAAFQQKCYDYFEELKARKQTVVFVSHDMGAVTRFCTRAIYIKSGKLILDGTPSEVADLYREENINHVQADNTDGNSEVDKTGKLSKGYGIDAKVIKDKNADVFVRIDYQIASPDDETYVGISVSRDGRSVVEITTDPSRPLTGNGSLTYSLDISQFNGGTYELAAALFRLHNRELLSFMKHGKTFVIKGDDIRRGAALKLADTWEYK